jgi:hypothetical protein
MSCFDPPQPVVYAVERVVHPRAPRLERVDARRQPAALIDDAEQKIAIVTATPTR